MIKTTYYPIPNAVYECSEGLVSRELQQDRKHVDEIPDQMLHFWHVPSVRRDANDNLFLTRVPTKA